MKSKFLITLALLISAIAGASDHPCPSGRCLQAADIYYGSSGSWIDLYMPASTPLSNRACVFDSNSALSSSLTTSTEIGYVHGVTSSIQAQINALGAGITGLTGDGTATGPGDVAFTLATVNSGPGTYPKVTVNGKGLVTSGTTLSGSDIPNNSANTTGSAGSFTGSLTGDVTGTQGATAIAATTVTGKAITGYSSTTGTVSDLDSILSAIEKLNGNSQAIGGSAITALTSDVSASGPGSVAATVNSVGGSTASSIHTSQLATAAATATDTASTIVARNSSKQFAISALLDDNGRTSIDVANRRIEWWNGSSLITSFDAGAQSILDTAGLGGMTWGAGSKLLVDDAGDEALEWDAATRVLWSVNGSQELQWSNSGVAFPQLTATTVPYLNGSKILTSSAVTPTQLSYVDATSSIQTQLNGKQATGSYITALTGDVTASGPGSSSATLAATTNATLTTLSGLTSASSRDRRHDRDRRMARHQGGARLRRNQRESVSDGRHEPGLKAGFLGRGRDRGATRVLGSLKRSWLLLD